jgi:hypothetical protein
MRNPLALFHLVGLPEIITPSPIMLKMQATYGAPWLQNVG